MRDIIKGVLDRHGVQDLQESVIEELIWELTQGGYVHIDNVKLDPERVIFTVSRILNDMQEERPLIVVGSNDKE